MAKITYSRAFDLQRQLWIGDWSAATISGTSTATSVTLALGSNIFTLTGTFTLSGNAPVSGTITGLSYATAGTAEFTLTGLSINYANFQQAIQDGDFNAIFGNGNDWVVGSASADKLYGYAGNDLIQGNAGNDSIVASYGNDTLDGGVGDDAMLGGNGDDSYVVDSTFDKVLEGDSAGTDTVNTSLSTYTLGANFENLTYTGTSTSVVAFTGTGNSLNNVMVGNKDADKLYGLAGNDTLRGGNGYDTLDGGLGNDFLVGDSGASAVTTSASGWSPSNGTLPITISMTMPEVATTTSTTITGYINNATLGSNKFNLAFVLDVSGSMAESFSGATVGDVNKDGVANEKIDAAIASFQALVNSLKASGLGEMVRISLIPFSDSSDIRAIGSATSDANANGIADVIDAAMSLNDLGGTNYGTGLSKAIEFFGGSPKGDNFVFFISDGQPGDTYAAQLNTLRDKAGINATIRSLGIESGSGGYYNVLDLLDDGLSNNSAIDVKSPAALTSSLLSSQVNLTDIKQLEIYKNGALVSTLLPSQLTQTPFGLKYSATVSGLSSTTADKIETRLVLKDASSSFIATSQYITVGTLASNDSLVGGDGNDTLDGGAGADILAGGLGNDLYHIETTGKTVYETSGAGNDTVEATFTYTLNSTSHANIENLTLLGSTSINGTGNALNNRIEGNIGNNILNGLGGSDTLIGGYGTDTASYANSTSAITANLSQTSAHVTATGKADYLVGIENIYGSAYADNITGDQNANTFRGGAGNDTLNGGGDDALDTVDYAAATSAVTVNLNVGYLGGTATSANGAEGTDTLDNIEGVVGSAYADTITDQGYDYYGINNLFNGGAGNDTLNGGKGNDTLVGGAGNDQLNGGDGLFDIVDYSKSTVAISGSLSGTMTVKTATTTQEVDTLSGIEGAIGTNYADSILGSAANDSIVGGADNDTLNGGSGNDTLIGGVGVDALIGGLGDDTFYIDTLSDITSEAASSGTDTLYIDISSGTGSRSLGEIENAILLGNASLNILGGVVSNNIVGGAGNDTINGGTNVGADTLNGGAGVDWLSYAGRTSGVGVTGTLNATYSTLIDGDTTSNFENLLGSAYVDNLTGDGYDNLIDGGAGDDNLYGGYGNDTLKGGLGLDRLDGDSGFDTVTYAHITATTTPISADLSTGVVTVNNGEGNDTLVEIEHIIGTSGNDSIQWVSTSTYSYTNFLLNGGVGNDYLKGSYGDDTLVGGTGNDTLHGGIGTSTYYIDVADYSAATAAVQADLSTGTATSTSTGTDTLISIEGVIGSAFGDTLSGKNSQSDFLQGGAGADVLDGSIDGYTDYFIYTAVNDSRGSTYDTIKNFVSTGYYTDEIDLSAIDADTSDSYDDYFILIGTTGFSGTAGELRYAKTTTDTFVYADVNGDKVADMTIKITGLHDLTQYNFTL